MIGTCGRVLTQNFINKNCGLSNEYDIKDNSEKDGECEHGEFLNNGDLDKSL